MNLKFKLLIFVISLFFRVNTSFEIDQVYCFTKIQNWGAAQQQDMQRGVMKTFVGKNSLESIATKYE
jgi:hypothetical protein